MPTNANAVTNNTDVEAMRVRLSALMPQVRTDLEALVRIPSVSATAFDQAHVDASAQAVATLLRDVGMPEVEILRARAGGSVGTVDGAPGGAPAVVARRPAPAGAPTVMLYAHHDVQPPGDDADWRSPPFEPTERDGRLFGRGAADDKAGVMAHLAALRTLLPHWDDDQGVGVTVFVEGEEEIGSPTFVDFLATHRERLSADVIVVADSTNWKVGVPALTTSLRGLVDCTVEVAVLEHAVHSGMYGGPVLDALTCLARLLATLHDGRGDVAVPGLVCTEAAELDLTDAQLRDDASVLDGVQLVGTGSLTSRLWTRPALSVIGIDAPSVANSSNTLLPRARAKISMRVAPGQDPRVAMDALRAHLEFHSPFGARVTVTDGELGRPFAARGDSTAMQAARESFAAAWGTQPVDIGVGGSIPFIAELLTAYPDAAILVTGVEDPDTRAHGANESLHLAEFERVCLAETLLLQRLADDCGGQPDRR